MFPDQLKKILNLIKKTGDRVVVFDSSAADDSYVIMDIDRYENMVLGEKVPVESIPPVSRKSELNPINSDLTTEKENLTEEDLTDKINREISVWKNRENTSYPAEEDKPKKAWTIPSNVKDKAQEVE